MTADQSDDHFISSEPASRAPKRDACGIIAEGAAIGGGDERDPFARGRACLFAYRVLAAGAAREADCEDGRCGKRTHVSRPNEKELSHRSGSEAALQLRIP